MTTASCGCNCHGEHWEDDCECCDYAVSWTQEEFKRRMFQLDPECVNEYGRLISILRSLVTEGNRLAVCCGHLDGDGTFDEVRCWNEVTSDARRALEGE